jgi:dipeptidyl aminopeptidase/acylaminoacyl peptidase
MQQDLQDAVLWAVGEGIAQRDRVAIMGGSYGGYAALVGLSFTPDFFACGIDLVGPSNLETLLASFPPYWAPLLENFARRVGDPRTEDGQALLRERSPLHRAAQIRRPLLMAQGANDVRVTRAESDQLAEAMRRNGQAVCYALYPDEGHGLARPANKLSFMALVENFLAIHLGGRCQPFDADLTAGSLQLLAGQDSIPGLSAAWRQA